MPRPPQEPTPTPGKPDVRYPCQGQREEYDANWFPLLAEEGEAGEALDARTSYYAEWIAPDRLYQRWSSTPGIGSPASAREQLDVQGQSFWRQAEADPWSAQTPQVTPEHLGLPAHLIDLIDLSERTIGNVPVFHFNARRDPAWLPGHRIRYSISVSQRDFRLIRLAIFVITPKIECFGSGEDDGGAVGCFEVGTRNERTTDYYYSNFNEAFTIESPPSL